MIQFVYQKVFDVIKEKPLVLWGTSLLYALLCALASVFGVLPIISLPICFVLEASMATIYLKGYRKEAFVSQDLFAGFSNFLHVAGGMAWKTLWLFLWLLIPIVGPIAVIIKAISYSMTEYILINHPEISATDALKASMEYTKGYKGNIFLTYLVFFLAIWIVVFVIGMLTGIEAISIFFWYLLYLCAAIIALFAPLFSGLIGAAFYDEIEKAVQFKKDHPGETYRPEYLKLQPIYVPYTPDMAAEPEKTQEPKSE